MDKKLFCCDCKDEIETCDECGEKFKKGDEIYCIGMNHYHENCIGRMESEAVSEDDRYI